MIDLNPYQPSTSVDDPAAKPVLALQRDPYLIVASICGTCIAAYVMLGTILNGLDFLRSPSMRDAITEAWLMLLLAAGFVVCTAAYRISKNRLGINRVHFSIATTFATILALYVEFF
ncbi:hypothetical protein CA13_11300 [Planctomycetes bacterium CA13]|uniref:Uncharacterized protein n=1 Tax=Novipirellula herctigrandis TaxID=2527986 RepID=A0A5C5YZ84_9BACT|nr:hypothetical protein CA13_11300 [Planctomycetes bacterium CA13]